MTKILMIGILSIVFCFSGVNFFEAGSDLLARAVYMFATASAFIAASILLLPNIEQFIKTHEDQKTQKKVQPNNR